MSTFRAVGSLAFSLVDTEDGVALYCHKTRFPPAPPSAIVYDDGVALLRFTPNGVVLERNIPADFAQSIGFELNAEGQLV